MKKLIITICVILALISICADAVRIGVVIEFPDGTIVKKCLSPPEGTNAYEILESTGLDIEWSYYDPWGHGLCKIEDTGCPASNCWCSSDYWNFYVRKIYENSWKYSPVGFDGGSSCNDHYCADDMDLLGFAYGPYGTKPEELSFNDVCAIRRDRTQKEFDVTVNPDEIYTNEEISIEVFDKGSLDPIENAIVEVYAGRAGVSRIVFSGKTDRNGTVSLSMEKKGDYEIRISVENYKPPQKYLELIVTERPTTTTTSSTTSTTSTSTTTSTPSTTTTTTTSSTTSTTSTSTIQTTTTIEKEPDVTGHAVGISSEGISIIMVLFILSLLFLYNVYIRR